MNHPPRPSTSTDRPPLQSKRLLDQLRERIRYLHYSLKTEEAYLSWSRAYIRFHGVRHPKDMGAAEVEAFLTHLTNVRRVSVSTHKQALSALLFLYREVIGVDLPWMNEMARPTAPRRIPSVLTIDEVAAVLPTGPRNNPASKHRWMRGWGGLSLNHRPTPSSASPTYRRTCGASAPR